MHDKIKRGCIFPRGHFLENITNNHVYVYVCLALGSLLIYTNILTVRFCVKTVTNRQWQRLGTPDCKCIGNIFVILPEQKRMMRMHTILFQFERQASMEEAQMPPVRICSKPGGKKVITPILGWQYCLGFQGSFWIWIRPFCRTKTYWENFQWISLWCLKVEVSCLNKFCLVSKESCLNKSTVITLYFEYVFFEKNVGRKILFLDLKRVGFKNPFQLPVKNQLVLFVSWRKIDARNDKLTCQSP